MKKINHSVLIVSVACALIILGASVFLGLRFGITPGLLTGLGSFTLLIACFLLANRRMTRREIRQKQAKEAVWKQIEIIAAQLEEKQAGEPVEKPAEEPAEELAGEQTEDENHA